MDDNDVQSHCDLSTDQAMINLVCTIMIPVGQLAIGYLQIVQCELLCQHGIYIETKPSIHIHPTQKAKPST